MCRERLIYEEDDSGDSSLVGEVAHIVGEKKCAARGDDPLPLDNRNAPENLLLLCRKHHKIIDDLELEYTVQKLQAIRSEYLCWLDTCLAKAQPWKTTLSQLCYLNVPRLSELATLNGYTVDLSSYRRNKTLYSLGWDLNRILLSFERLFSRLTLEAIPVEPIEFVHEKYIGSIASFDRVRFRTKNIPTDALHGEVEGRQVFSGDLKKDPHIYFKNQGGWMLVLNIDPSWITTSTAFTLFRPSGGQSTFSGLTRITNVDYEKRLMFGSPLVIGLPRGPMEGILDEA